MSSLFPNHNSLPGGIRQSLYKFFIRVFFNFRKVSRSVFIAACLWTKSVLVHSLGETIPLAKVRKLLLLLLLQVSFPRVFFFFGSCWSLVSEKKKRGEGRAGKVGMKEESSLFCQKRRGAPGRWTAKVVVHFTEQSSLERPCLQCELCGHLLQWFHNYVLQS